MLTTPAILRQLRDVVEPLVDRLGYELVGIELGGGAQGPVLRVSIDHAAGVGITDCTKVSRQLSPALDVADPIIGGYDLEVSTPGIERPVQKAEDFVRFAGCEIRVKPFGIDNKRRTRGTLLGLDAGVVSVKVADAVKTFPIDAIERANLLLTAEQFQRLGEGLPPLQQANP
ncbi:MAG: ribosome maturation factor RimP [Myxococcales bacterium]|nr:ribosome maturation factor RimP [Myxococcales bacterium]